MRKRRKQVKNKRRPEQHPIQESVAPGSSPSEREPRGEEMPDMNDLNPNRNLAVETEESEELIGYGEAQVLTAFMESFSRLEKVVRGMARDSLAITRNQRETQTALQAIQERIGDLELTTKGFTQTVWRATQDNQEQIQKAEDHFAGAVRELEDRVREEMKLLLRKSTLQAVFPALDDLDLVIGNQKALLKVGGQEDGFLEAMVLVRQKLVDGLRSLGLEEISIEEGVTPFDPGTHEAVETDIPADLLLDQDMSAGTIIRVRRAGYCFEGRTLRAPQVIIKTDKS